MEESAWKQEPQTVGEENFTPGRGVGYLAWNKWSAEVEFAEFAGDLIKIVKPQIIVETGCGQGYSSRRMIKNMKDNDKLILFDSDDDWRDSLKQIMLPRNVTVSNFPTPSREEYELADLCVLDSNVNFRIVELELFDEYALSGCIILVHDTDMHRDKNWQPHKQIRKAVKELKNVDGLFFDTPRGCYLGRHK